MNELRLSSCERRPAPKTKHVSLTHFLRRDYVRHAHRLNSIIDGCDVVPHVGALPTQLRARVEKQDIALITSRFRDAIEEFLVDNARTLCDGNMSATYVLPKIGEMFGTDCIISSRGKYQPLKQSNWRGAVGVVCKMSFPEIKCDYALKFFFNAHNCHGPMYEIPTAIASYHAEPKDNNRVYMASFFHIPYMLSQWAGDDADGICARRNKYEIFTTSQREMRDDNYRLGRRIDWGDTGRTAYGALSYRGRKIYRQLDKIAWRNGQEAVQNLLNTPCALPQQRDMIDGVRLFYYQFYHYLPDEILYLLKEKTARYR